MRVSGVILISLLLGCSPFSKEKMKNDNVLKDPHTFADPKEAKIDHLSLDILVNFDEQKISGTATYDITNFGAKKIYFDTKALRIEKVVDENGHPLPFQLGEEQPHLGSQLSVDLITKTTRVGIVYETSKNAEALQWLMPVQTAGKSHPFLFTQSQAILARSWIPIQDSPGIRFTYDARVKVPEGLLALMSAENPVALSGDGVYTFKMDQPIPAYLMALAVGNLRFKPLTDRTGVYAEPEMLEKSAFEFTDMESMLQIAEGIYGPYRWERYDVIVLPPSFPFGGMENPRLTFATPTIITGDKSLVSLIAHEMAHSWSGNLVTNATWNDFWLNEGFTVYFEYRIMAALYGQSYAEMLASLAQQDLKAEVAQFVKDGMAEDTRLKLDLTGRNPDDGVSTIAYDKGYNFLRYLDELVGREKFDEFVKGYFEKNSFKSMNTELFLDYLKKELFDKNNIETDWAVIEEWIYGEGLPSTFPTISSERFDKVDEQIKKWMTTYQSEELDTSGWTTHEWLHFLRQIPDTAKLDQLKLLDNQFGLTSSSNAEIQCVWYQKCLQHGYTDAYSAMEEFLIKTGRRKFLTPLYTQMAKTEQGKALARKIYVQARPNYHFVSVNTMDKILNWKE